MLVQGSYEKARCYIEAHSNPDSERLYEHYPCITISRQTGAGSDIITPKLLNYFNRQKKSDSPEWTIFDKNLITKVLEDHHLPAYLDHFLQENKHSAFSSIISELITGQPSALSLAIKCFQTIYHLGRTGNVIIVGRGANFITAKLRNSFHVRLVAPLEQRMKHVEEIYNLGRKEAEVFIKKDDEARRLFVLTHFQKNVEDPLHYNLVINTGTTSHSDAAKIIGKAVVRRLKNSSADIRLQPSFGQLH